MCSHRLTYYRLLCNRPVARHRACPLVRTRRLPPQRSAIALRVLKACAARKAAPLPRPVAINHVPIYRDYRATPRAHVLVPRHRQEPPRRGLGRVLPLRPLDVRVLHPRRSLLLSRLPAHCLLLSLGCPAGGDGPCLDTTVAYMDLTPARCPVAKPDRYLVPTLLEGPTAFARLSPSSGVCRIWALLRLLGQEHRRPLAVGS
jgi:hypothetical protein